MLAVDDAVESEAERIELPLQRTEGILATIKIVWREGDKTLFREALSEGVFRPPCSGRWSSG